MAPITKNIPRYISREKKSKRKLTYDDYCFLDDGKRYELIEGILNMSPAPSYFHQDFLGQLYNQLSNYTRSIKSGKVNIAPLDVILDEHNTVQPDLVYIAKENYGIIQERGIFGAPNAAIEIISLSSAVYDRNTKKALYEKFGIKEYWLIDTANRVFEIFVNNKGKYELFSSGGEMDNIKSKVIPGFEIQFGTIFQNL